MRLTTNLEHGNEVPYFLWDEPLTVNELKQRLAEGEMKERIRLAGKVLREARFDEATKLVRLDFLVAHYHAIRRHLGRRLRFWDYLMNEWRALGLLPE